MKVFFLIARKRTVEQCKYCVFLCHVKTHAMIHICNDSYATEGNCLIVLRYDYNGTCDTCLCVKICLKALFYAFP